MQTLLPVVLLLMMCAADGPGRAEVPAKREPIEHRVEVEGSAAGPAAPVRIEMDERAIPHIEGQSIEDVMFGHGFVHGRDRLFQMDVTRRLAAGELAALAGPAVIEMDRQARVHRLRAVAQQVLERLPADDRALLEAYAAGVNAAIAARERPTFEHGSLNAEMKPWRPEDSILVGLGMFNMLHIEATFEKRIGVMRDALPEELVDFLTPISTRFDAPLIFSGEALGRNDWEPMPIPGPHVVDLRGRSAVEVEDLVEPGPLALGSNNWAVAGSRSSHGGAILANDMHLPLTVPNVWHRAQLSWEGTKGQRGEGAKGEGRGDIPPGSVGGLTLPGMPGIISGSNGQIAWGFTNAMGDYQDLIIIEVHPDDPALYRTPDGYEPFEEITERIEIRGRGWETLTLKKTRWGVVTGTDHRRRPLVLKWTALDPDLINMRIFDLATAETLEQAVDAAQQWGGPPQNVLIAHRDGRIAWTISGAIPKRIGFDGKSPQSWADGDIYWDGFIAPQEKPTLIDPEEGILFTANNRTVGVKDARRMGGIWTPGERAGRIATLLRAGKEHDERDLLQVQLDTRVEALDFYHEIAAGVMASADRDEALYDDARAVLGEWDGTAEADQAGLVLVDQFRRLLHRRILGPLVAPAREFDPAFLYRWFMEEEPVRRIIEERPAHLLPPGYASWDELFERTWLETLRRIETAHENGLRTSWGALNRSRIAHPLTQILPALADRLNMPEAPQSGHPFAVRVAGPSFGASNRTVVSPGREERGILHMPGGQSGDPRSPHYADGHDDWLRGAPQPFLPGEAREVIVLTPADGGR